MRIGLEPRTRRSRTRRESFASQIRDREAFLLPESAWEHFDRGERTYEHFVGSPRLKMRSKFNHRAQQARTVFCRARRAPRSPSA